MPFLKANDLLSMYEKRLMGITDIGYQVILTHIFTDHIMIKMIEKFCVDQEITDYRYPIKVTILHSMGKIPDKLSHNLLQLNTLRNRYAHKLSLKVDQKIEFYSSLRSDEKEIANITEPNFENNVQWLCEAAFLDLYNTAYDSGVNLKF